MARLWHAQLDLKPKENLGYSKKCLHVRSITLEGLCQLAADAFKYNN